MKVIAPILLLSLLAACGTPPRPTTDVMIMPNDCANRVAIGRWIEDQAAVPKNPFQTQEQYDRQQSFIRRNLWTLRYNCQPV
jgi:hypothetical protein